MPLGIRRGGGEVSGVGNVGSGRHRVGLRHRFGRQRFVVVDGDFGALLDGLSLCRAVHPDQQHDRSGQCGHDRQHGDKLFAAGGLPRVNPRSGRLNLDSHTPGLLRQLRQDLRRQIGRPDLPWISDSKASSACSSLGFKLSLFMIHCFTCCSFSSTHCRNCCFARCIKFRAP